MDSVWNFQHPGGSFEVEFRADAFNHFVSKVWLGLRAWLWICPPSVHSPFIPSNEPLLILDFEFCPLSLNS